MYGIYEYYSCGGPGTLPSSKTGFLHRCMYLPNQERHEIEHIINTHSRFVILIQQNEYAMFLFQIEIQPLLHTAKKPYVIVTCMDDPTFPDKVVGSFFNTVMEDGKSKPEFKLFRKWFTTNCSVRDINGLAPATALKKLSPIPYGVDYWTLTLRKTWANTPMAAACRQDRELSALRNSMVHFSKRRGGGGSGDLDPKIYINFQFNLNGNGCFERLLAFYSISRDLMNIERRRVNRYETWGAYTQNIFVASPRGNGLDTIRTWEALMLGCIVIIRRLPDAPVMEELYADLPVVLVDRWSDVTRDFLTRILSEYSRRTFNYEKLSMQYWINQIESAFDE
jgi:hypothetical protein